MSGSFRKQDRGAALVTVLWLTAALAVIAFSLARSIREETTRTENLLLGTRASLLARAGIERTLFWLAYPPPQPRPGDPPIFAIGQQRVMHQFPGGDVLVDILPESGKLAINIAKPEQILAVLLAAGMNPIEAQTVTQAIVAWRTPESGGSPPLLLPASTFWMRHASYQEIEELLMTPGVTPAWFYGHRAVLPGGGTVARPGLRELLSVHGSLGPFDVNSAHPALLTAMGVPPAEVARIIERRRIAPITPRELSEMGFAAGDQGQLLRAGLDRAYTFTATAWPRDPSGKRMDFRRAAAALIVYESVQPPIERPVLQQWYESVTPWEAVR
jgi:hypothetical protein